MDHQFGPDDMEVLDDQLLYQGFYQMRGLTLRHRLFLGGWSQAIKRELFHRFDAVGVLLYDPDLDAVDPPGGWA